MDLTQLNQRIAVANAESQRINNERAVNLGKKETLEKQLQDAITHYNATYNTNITVASLNAEIERVAKEKELEVANIESVLALIKEGRFDEAQQKVSGVVPTSQSVSPTPQTAVPQPTTPALGDIPVSPQATTPAIGEPVVAPTVPVVEKTVEQSVVPTAPVIEESVTPPTAPVTTEAVSEVPVVPKAPVIEESVTPPPAPVITSSVSNIEESMTPVGAPPVIGKPPVAPNLGNTVTPPPTAPVTSFNAILNGSQFKPQGN